MNRSRALLAMLLAALLAGGVGWSRARVFGKNLDRGIMANGYRSVAVLTHDYDLLDVRPGDRVDVLVVFDAAVSGAPRKFAATILQNAMVLGTTRSGKLDGKGVAYLMLNPFEAQYAALSAHQGELSVIVRKPGDKEIHPVEMADFRSLFR
jgi:Flp pilus assembly protein CpaB